VYWLLIDSSLGLRGGGKTKKAFSSVGEKAFQQHLKSNVMLKNFMIMQIDIKNTVMLSA
jgi:hypothetical protein